MEQQTTTYLGTQIAFNEERELGAVLHLTGEIDIASGSVLSGAFQDLIDLGLMEVIVDTSRVTFMDSTGFHALVEGKRLTHDVGMRLALIVSPQVRRVLDLLLPEPLFAARVDTMEQARQSLGWSAL